MTQQIVYPNGEVEVSVPVGSYIMIGAYEANAKIFLGVSDPNMPLTYSYLQQVENGEVTLGTYSAVQMVKIFAGPGKVYYNVGAAPKISISQPTSQRGTQGAPTAKTTSATLTAAEILAGIITVNQGGGAGSALQLPTASAMDTAIADSVAGDAVDFSVINISTNAAEDATITTNTGWTLVGNIDIASNAAATDKSAGRFRARKTAAGAWTLYRLS